MAAADSREEPEEGLTRGAVVLARRLACLQAYAEAHADPKRAKATAALAQRCASDLEALLAALARAAQGGYGRCSACGKRIGTLRLRHFPLAESCAQCASVPDVDWEAGVREEHVRLLALLPAIAEVLRETDRAAGRALALQLISDLRREIYEHFALEEMGGYVTELLLAAPRLTKTAEELENQHAVLEQSADELVACAAGAVAAAEDWLEVERRFDALREVLLAHESAENDLIRDALMGDIGRGD